MTLLHNVERKRFNSLTYPLLSYDETERTPCGQTALVH